MAHFLQSPAWEQFQKKVGRKTFRTENGTLIIMHPLPARMRYAYIGGAPIDNNSIKEVKRIAAKEHAMFLKWESMEEQNEHRISLLENGNFRQVMREIQPQQTLCIDLRQDMQAILGSMHHKTRYNIRLAQRRGVQIEFHASPSIEQKEMFFNLLEETAKRDGFHLHEKNYYFSLCDMTGIELAIARVQGHVVAIHLILFFEDRVMYLHGGSSYAHRASRASYLLQWGAIQEAKQRECKAYDFWGIDEKKWPGITRFKEGFGGQKVSYIGSWDYILSKPFYVMYWLKQKIR